MVYKLTCRQNTHVHKIKTNHHKIKKKISGQGYGMVDICYAQDSYANFKNHLTSELLDYSDTLILSINAHKHEVLLIVLMYILIC